MKAELLMRERFAMRGQAFVEVLIWRTAKPVPGSKHCYKYRLAHVVNNMCVLRYDNESGKGDHKHVGRREIPYTFTTLEQLQADFWTDVQAQDTSA